MVAWWTLELRSTCWLQISLGNLISLVGKRFGNLTCLKMVSPIRDAAIDHVHHPDTLCAKSEDKSRYHTRN